MQVTIGQPGFARSIHDGMDSGRVRCDGNGVTNNLLAFKTITQKTIDVDPELTAQLAVSLDDSRTWVVGTVIQGQDRAARRGSAENGETPLIPR